MRLGRQVGEETCAFEGGRRREVVDGQRKVDAAIAAKTRIAVFAGGIRVVLVAAVVSGRHGLLHVRRGHRAAANGHARVSKRLRREGKRDQQGEENPEKTHAGVWPGQAGTVKKLVGQQAAETRET